MTAKGMVEINPAVKFAQAADFVVPYLCAKALSTLCRVHPLFRALSGESNRKLETRILYPANRVRKDATALEKAAAELDFVDEFPRHGFTSAGDNQLVQNKLVTFRADIVSRYIRSVPGLPTGMFTEENIKWGSALDEKRSQLTTVLVFDDADRTPVPHLGTGTSANITRIFKKQCVSDFNYNDGTFPVMKVSVHRLSSHFRPPVKFRIRVTTSVALRPGPNSERGNNQDNQDNQDALTHYNGFTEAFWVTSRIQTPASIATQKRRRRLEKDAHRHNRHGQPTPTGHS